MNKSRTKRLLAENPVTYTVGDNTQEFGALATFVPLKDYPNYTRPVHDKETCRIYGCLWCASLAVNKPERGLRSGKPAENPLQKPGKTYCSHGKSFHPGCSDGRE